MKCKHKQYTAERREKSIGWTREEEKSSNKENADMEDEEQQVGHKKIG